MTELRQHLFELVQGQVPGEVVTAAFGVFNPAIVIPAVDRGNFERVRELAALVESSHALTTTLDLDTLFVILILAVLATQLGPPLVPYRP